MKMPILVSSPVAEHDLNYSNSPKDLGTKIWGHNKMAGNSHFKT